ncbi:hypothetical protein LIA77_04510 [Sarocladium implicatum]|nr:hypothetical protein LIA77_04510 [Sarocladium implicatum]
MFWRSTRITSPRFPQCAFLLPRPLGLLILGNSIGLPETLCAKSAMHFFFDNRHRRTDLPIEGTSVEVPEAVGFNTILADILRRRRVRSCSPACTGMHGLFIERDLNWHEFRNFVSRHVHGVPRCENHMKSTNSCDTGESSHGIFRTLFQNASF